jgi:hypothetical protein
MAHLAACLSVTRSFFAGGVPMIIHVELLDEGTKVWRPVEALHVDATHYRIESVNADLEDETWRFQHGDVVRCEPFTFAGGEVGLVAVEKVEVTTPPDAAP